MRVSAGGGTRGHENPRQRFGLLAKFDSRIRRHNLGLDKDLQPIQGLVNFLNDDTKLGDEVWTGPGPTYGSIVCANAGSRSQELASNDARFVSVRQGRAEADDVDGETLCALAEFLWSHSKLQCTARTARMSPPLTIEHY